MRIPIGSRRAIVLVLWLCWPGIPGCGGGERVTEASLRAARARWAQAGIRDYDLNWTNSGPGNPHYRVAVRDGKVQSIYWVLPNGTTREAHIPEPRYYSVDGLFLTIADELAQLRTDTPFGRPKG